MALRRKAVHGFQLIHLMGLIIITLMFSAFAIDFGVYFAVQNRLQTAADAAALAATTEFYNSDALDPHDRMDSALLDAQLLAEENLSDATVAEEDVSFGFIDPATKLYDSATFDEPSDHEDYSWTGGYNAVRVRVQRAEGSINPPLRTIMANMFGVSSMNTAAFSVALIDNTVSTITDGGLRPIYACKGQLDIAMSDNIPENNVIRIYGDHLTVDGVGVIAGCPAPGSGNWGFSDFRDCGPGAPSNKTMRDWVRDGYDGTVATGECYSTQPGNFLNPGNDIGDAFESLVGRTILIPIYDGYSGGGSNTSVNIASFAGFRITQVNRGGNPDERNIQGHFTRAICNQGCSSSNDGSAPGGAVVRIRLASQS